MGILPLETGELGPAQIIGELSVLKGAREVVQQTLDFTAYLSPFYGGDKWWNGFGRGRMEGEALGQELFTLPEIQNHQMVMIVKKHLNIKIIMIVLLIILILV